MLHEMAISYECQQSSYIQPFLASLWLSWIFLALQAEHLSGYNGRAPTEQYRALDLVNKLCKEASSLLFRRYAFDMSPVGTPRRKVTRDRNTSSELW